jgi:hypothetical protein
MIPVSSNREDTKLLISIKCRVFESKCLKVFFIFLKKEVFIASPPNIRM